MTETPTEYRFSKPMYTTKMMSERVLSSVYGQTVLKISEAALWGGGIDRDDILDYAIAFTDKLIERVGEKL